MRPRNVFFVVVVVDVGEDGSALPCVPTLEVGVAVKTASSICVLGVLVLLRTMVSTTDVASA